MEPNSLPSAPALALSLKLEVLEFQGASLRRGQFLTGLGFELMPLRFELGNVRRGRHGGAAGGNQEISRVSGLDLDAIADLTEVRDLLQQYDVHVRSPI